MPMSSKRSRQLHAARISKRSRISYNPQLDTLHTSFSALPNTDTVQKHLIEWVGDESEEASWQNDGLYTAGNINYEQLEELTSEREEDCEITEGEE